MPNESLPPYDGLEPTLTEPETAKQKFERERMTRRQALKRFGMTSAMATFALFSVDDLARMVGGAMERQARNSKIAAQVAEEFQHSGIAVGAVMPNPSYYPYINYSYYPGPGSIPDPPSADEIGRNCASKPSFYGGGTTTCEGCVAEGCGNNYPAYTGHQMPAHDCTVAAQNKYCAISTA